MLHDIFDIRCVIGDSKFLQDIIIRGGWAYQYSVVQRSQLDSVFQIKSLF